MSLVKAPASSDPIAHLDFDLVCSAEKCTRPASWMLRCTACGASEPLCEAHKRRNVTYSRAGITSVGCGACSTWASDWRDLFQWIPIGTA